MHGNYNAQDNPANIQATTYYICFASSVVLEY